MIVISDEEIEFTIDKYLQEIWLTLYIDGYGDEDYKGYLVVMNNLVYFIYKKYTDMWELDYHILENWKIKDNIK